MKKIGIFLIMFATIYLRTFAQCDKVNIVFITTDLCINKDISVTVSLPSDIKNILLYWDNETTAVSLVSGKTTNGKFLIPGDHSYRLSDSTGSCIKSGTFKVGQVPTAQFINPTINCAGDTVTFVNTSTGNNITKYAWTFGSAGNQTFSNEVSPRLLLPASRGGGSVNVPIKLIAYSYGVCAGEVQSSVNVKQMPNDPALSAVPPYFDLGTFKNCAGVDPNFALSIRNATSTSNVAQFEVEWGDITATTYTTADKTWNHTYTSFGLFYLRAKSIGINGCIATKIYPVINSTKPDITYTYKHVGSQCANDTNSLEMLSIKSHEHVTEDTKYTWDFGDGTIMSFNYTQSNATITHHYKYPSCGNDVKLRNGGTETSVCNDCYAIIVTASNGCGVFLLAAAPITIYGAPEVDISVTANTLHKNTPKNLLDTGYHICRNDTAKLANITTTCTPNTIGLGEVLCDSKDTLEWEIVNAETLIPITANVKQIYNSGMQCDTIYRFKFTQTGKYFVKLTQTNTCGTNFKKKLIVVDGPFDMKNKIETTPPWACDTLRTTLRYKSDSAPWYTWNVTPKNGFTFVNPFTKNSWDSTKMVFTTPGIKAIRLYAENACERDSMDVTVTVKEKPKMEIYSTNIICGLKINPKGKITNTTDSVKYWWKFTDGTPTDIAVVRSTQREIEIDAGLITYSKYGDYKAYLYAQNECPVKSVLAEFKFREIPKPMMNLRTYICFPEPLDVSNVTESTDVSMYKWGYDVTDSILWLDSTSEKRNFSITFATADFFNVSLYARSSFGCSDTTDTLVESDVCADLYVPNAFLPNSSNIAVNRFMPVGESLIKYKMEIYNLYGQILWSTEVIEDGKPKEGWDGTFKGKPCQTDTYIWKIQASFYDGTNEGRRWEGQTLNNKKRLTTGTFSLIR